MDFVKLREIKQHSLYIVIGTKLANDTVLIKGWIRGGFGGFTGFSPLSLCITSH